ncbi:phosphatase PAP2 family protein [Nibribacter ruber]|uniref:Phosphatase PAP2 family protein n=1 Tax=Nibribacter ruber TaxID=2698458 RepID=A0A6P1P3I6_9BACT|nr:phosphatase PAP2 family protein [Nibribacter ruber]QHL88941.1 phosphatase PAP2 family protein [Nibribacter ruber]
MRTSESKRDHWARRIGALVAALSIQVLLIWLVFVGSALLFFWMVTEVFVEQEKDLDQAAFAFVGDFTTPEFTDAMYFITFFGSKYFLIFGSLGLALFFFIFKKWRFYSLKVISIAATTTLFNQTMKWLFGRPRPETAFLEQGGNSFPSGHAMIGGAFWGLLLYLVWTNIERRWLRWLLSLLLVLWILLIGFSRVYLNVHYASDVLAGWGAGFFWLILAIALLKKIQQRMGRKIEAEVSEE